MLRLSFLSFFSFSHRKKSHSQPKQKIISKRFLREIFIVLCCFPFFSFVFFHPQSTLEQNKRKYVYLKEGKKEATYVYRVERSQSVWDRKKEIFGDHQQVAHLWIYSFLYTLLVFATFLISIYQFFPLSQ